MKLREANIGDIEAIAEVMELLRKESSYKVFPLNKGKLIEFIEYLIGDENSLAVLAENKGIKGLFIGSIDELYFSDCIVASDFIFYVSPENRGEGIGTKLIEYYLKWADLMKADEVSLSTSTGIADRLISEMAKKYGMTKKGSSYGRIRNVQ